MTSSFLKSLYGNLKVNLLFLVLFLIVSARAFAQDSCHLRISILTASPGEELYETFGHSAVRIMDSVRNADIVYNYGTFNFDEPNFYLKFVRGTLPFYLSVDNFDDFIAEYQQENRGITEQVLNLTCYQKQRIYALLNENMMGPNRLYQYKFTFDNCTTRLRDLIERGTDSSVHFGRAVTQKVTFRDLIYVYLNNNDKQWSKLGIDILLGSRMDVAATPYQVMFLPDYLMNTLDSSTVNSQPLVRDKNPLFKTTYAFRTKDNLTNPLFLFICLFVVIAFLSFSKNRSVQKILASFDGFLIFITGFLGILILVMWFGTDHIMCRDNYNLLWAWPMNVVAAFYIHSKRDWPKKYFLIYAFFLLLVLVFWQLIPQHFNTALLPIFLILILRCFIYVLREK